MDEPRIFFGAKGQDQQLKILPRVFRTHFHVKKMMEKWNKQNALNVMKPNRSFWIPEPPSTPKMLQNCFKLTKQLQSWCLLSITAVSSTGPLSSKSCRRKRETPNSAARCSFSLLTFGRGLAATKVGFSAGRLGLESKLCPNSTLKEFGALTFAQETM